MLKCAAYEKVLKYISRLSQNLSAGPLVLLNPPDFLSAPQRAGPDKIQQLCLISHLILRLL